VRFQEKLRRMTEHVIGVAQEKVAGRHRRLIPAIRAAFRIQFAGLNWAEHARGLLKSRLSTDRRTKSSVNRRATNIR
jgi:hypothetical protein